jgi:hypothetical protein
LLVVPIDEKMGLGRAVLLSGLPAIIFRRWPHQIHLIGRLAGQDRFCIDISRFHQVLFREHMLLIPGFVNLRERLAIWDGSNGRRNVGNESGEILIAGFREKRFLANPVRRAFGRR